MSECEKCGNKVFYKNRFSKPCCSKCKQQIVWHCHTCGNEILPSNPKAIQAIDGFHICPNCDSWSPESLVTQKSRDILTEVRQQLSDDGWNDVDSSLMPNVIEQILFTNESLRKFRKVCVNNIPVRKAKQDYAKTLYKISRDSEKFSKYKQDVINFVDSFVNEKGIETPIPAKAFKINYFSNDENIRTLELIGCCILGIIKRFKMNPALFKKNSEPCACSFFNCVFIKKCRVCQKKFLFKYTDVEPVFCDNTQHKSTLLTKPFFSDVILCEPPTHFDFIKPDDKKG